MPNGKSTMTNQAEASALRNTCKMLVLVAGECETTSKLAQMGL